MGDLTTTAACLDCGQSIPPRPSGRTGPAPKRCGACRGDRDLRLRRERHARGKLQPKVLRPRSTPRGSCLVCGKSTEDREGPGVADYCAACKRARANVLAKAARNKRLADRFGSRYCSCGAGVQKPAYGPWPKSCPECTETRNRQSHRKSYEVIRHDPEKWVAYLDRLRPLQQAWRTANPDRVSERDRLWRKKNPHRVRETKHRRRARLASACSPGVSDRDWRRLLRRYRFTCAYCGDCGFLTMDHIVPIARGGRHSIGNVLPACGRCNSSKRDRLLFEWRVRLRARRPSPANP